MKNFRTLDLNLLRVFDAVMTQGSMTRAAESLAITQPAASHALQRLNAWVGEPLFQRAATGMKPTARAAALWPQVRAALQDLQRSLAPGAFDPAQDRAEFRITMADAAAGILAPAMASAVEAEAAQRHPGALHARSALLRFRTDFATRPDPVAAIQGRAATRRSGTVQRCQIRA